MQPLVLEFAKPEQLVDRIYPNGRFGGIAVPGHCQSLLGDKIRVCVKFDRPVREFEVEGQLAWVRHKSSATLKASYGIDFLENPERLLRFVHGELDASVLRLFPRVVTNLVVQLVHDGKTRREFIADISKGGAFVRTIAPIPIGDSVQINMKLPGSLLGFSVDGRVVWHRNTGNSSGFGIEFDFHEATSKSQLEKLVARLHDL